MSIFTAILIFYYFLKIIRFFLKKNKKNLPTNQYDDHILGLKINPQTDCLKLKKNFKKINNNNILLFLEKQLNRNCLRFAIEFSCIFNFLDATCTDFRRIFIERVKGLDELIFQRGFVTEFQQFDIKLTEFFAFVCLTAIFFKFNIF